MGVDMTDRHATRYCFLTKSPKWWWKLFFWDIDMCIINSYIMYKTVSKTKNEKPFTHLKYIKL